MHKKTVLVTGASRGIGRAIAMTFAQNNYHVFLNCRHSISELESVKSAIEAIPYGSCDIFIGDVGNPHSVKELYEMIYTKYDCLDVLVNNAGITKDGLLMKMSEDDFDAVVDTNLKGAFHCIRFVSRAMIRQRSGRIINISSVSGVLGNAGQANYAASKAGVIGLTKSAARELAGRKITVNAVAPGFIRTEMTAVLSEKVKEKAVLQIPMERFGEAEDVAQAVAFLASEQAGYITGQVLCVDGGMAM